MSALSCDRSCHDSANTFENVAVRSHAGQNGQNSQERTSIVISLVTSPIFALDWTVRIPAHTYQARVPHPLRCIPRQHLLGTLLPLVHQIQGLGTRTGQRRTHGRHALLDQ